MKKHRALRVLADVVKTYQPRHWTFDSSGGAYFNAETQREWSELSDAFDWMTGNRPSKRDTGSQYVNEWQWGDWKLNVAMPVDAPTGYEATA
jgi:hypothetical protein